MSRQLAYIQIFQERDVAERWMVAKNRFSRDGQIFCLVDGPDDDYAVVDLATAIDLGGVYTWTTR